jgi:hypothetical protein
MSNVINAEGRIKEGIEKQDDPTCISAIFGT